jgi:hemoglobin
MEKTLFERIGGMEKLRPMLWNFYADVRQHQVIGPIFNARIQNWPEHVAKIAEFWARATGGPSNYAGQMPLKHLALGLAPEHFAAWLALWDWNCKRHLPAAEAEEMSALAHGIGERLRQITRAAKDDPFRFSVS